MDDVPPPAADGMTIVSWEETTWLDILPRDSKLENVLSSLFFESRDEVVCEFPDSSAARNSSAADLLPEDGAALATAAGAGAGGGGGGPLRLLLSDDGGHDAVLLLAGRFRLPVLIPESMVMGKMT